MSFWSELKRRKVVRVVVAYAVVAWVIIEVVTATEEPLGLPEWTDTLVIVLLGLGFFVAAILAWAFDVTPDGVQRTTPDGHWVSALGSDGGSNPPGYGFYSLENRSFSFKLSGSGVTLSRPVILASTFHGLSRGSIEADSLT
jgi:hypothetical protein